MTARVHRAWGVVALLAGLLLIAEGARPWMFPTPGRPWTWTHGLTLLAGLFPALAGAHLLVTGRPLSMWRR